MFMSSHAAAAEGYTNLWAILLVTLIYVSAAVTVAARQQNEWDAFTGLAGFVGLATHGSSSSSFKSTESSESLELAAAAATWSSPHADPDLAGADIGQVGKGTSTLSPLTVSGHLSVFIVAALSGTLMHSNAWDLITCIV